MSRSIPKISRKAADVTKLVSKLRYEVQERRKLKNFQGHLGRHERLRRNVTALLKHERIELNYQRGDEARGYAERLISDAIRYGDCHKETMAMADYWISEKPIVHKLFKVIAPRLKDCKLTYTRILKAPKFYPGGEKNDRAVLELRGNIYPPLSNHNTNNKLYIHNVLLDEAKKEFRKEKYAAMAEGLAPTELNVDEVSQEMERISLDDNKPADSSPSSSTGS